MLRLLLALVFSTLLPGCVTNDNEMTDLPSYIEDRLAEVPDESRIELLRPLADAVATRESLDIVFICTHNSRRSHLSQLWAQAGARHFGFDGVHTFSGGTEATAFNPRAVAAMRRAGFQIEASEEASNPVYTVTDDNGLRMECFSKKFGDPPNPIEGFAAVMTCSEADRGCPLVPGAELRFSIPYVDPKVSDGTPEEAATYDERCRQIATEMLWVMKTASQAR